MRKKFILFLFTLIFLTAVQPGELYSSGKVVRIGYLGNEQFSSRLDAAGKDLLDELRKLGWIEGQNIVIEQRYWENRVDRLIDQAVEFVRLRVDIIVTSTGTGAQIAKKATTVIPIVMVSSADAVTQGLANSLAHPGGNVTGLTSSSTWVTGKQFELIKEAFPKTSRVAFVRCGGSKTGPSNPGLGKKQWNEAQDAARVQKIRLLPVAMPGPGAVEDPLEITGRERLDALAVADCVTVSARELIELAARSRLPAIYPLSRFVRQGGLMSYGADQRESYRRAGQFVDKILKGANPAELPIEQPTKFEFVINLKTARQFGVTIPPEVLMWANEVIK
jgi:putative ABC transport system substrate-binding protein